ncbi:metallophosphoesterase family protein [Halodurantibacterium flavum]|uniref:Metallophosphoesterase family protein n=1 Tax=Halodurantibacterium flavum TaxID=1382802 RepID=A0ABW4S6L2_9RHOB
MSDLHFGRERQELHTPLIEAVNALAPDLTVISGDLTQRARPEQFEAAAAFIAQLRAPVLSVPGNHDIPLYNLAMRAVRPFRRYLKSLGPLESTWSAPGLTVAAINSADPMRWQRGRIRRGSLRRACAAFRNSAPGDLRVLVLHHPLQQEEESGKASTIGADAALRRLGDCGLDLVLSGHLHRWSVAPWTRLDGGGGGAGSAVQVQAGTGLSDRLRGEENDFNLITRDGDRLSVTRYIAGPDDSFTPLPILHLRRGDDGWMRE